MGFSPRHDHGGGEPREKKPDPPLGDHMVTVTDARANFTGDKQYLFVDVKVAGGTHDGAEYTDSVFIDYSDVNPDRQKAREKAMIAKLLGYGVPLATDATEVPSLIVGKTFTHQVTANGNYRNVRVKGRAPAQAATHAPAEDRIPF
jgi:uncharacterized lipoprotein